MGRPWEEGGILQPQPLHRSCGVLWNPVGTGVQRASTIQGRQAPAPSEHGPSSLHPAHHTAGAGGNGLRTPRRPAWYLWISACFVHRLPIHLCISTEGERGTHKNPKSNSAQTPTVLSVQVLPARARGNGALAAGQKQPHPAPTGVAGNVAKPSSWDL